MYRIDNESPKRYLRFTFMIGLVGAPLGSIVLWLVGMYLVENRPSSFLGHYPFLPYLVALAPQFGWFIYFRIKRITFTRWARRIDIGPDGIVAEFEFPKPSTKHFSWDQIERVELYSGPWSPQDCAGLILRGGEPCLDLEVWGSAAHEFKKRVEEFKFIPRP